MGNVIDDAVDSVVDAGGEALNALGVDNDCTGESVTDHLCQTLGGAEAVNDGISTGIQVAGSAALGGGSFVDAALDYGTDYLIGQAADAAIDHGADIVSDLGFDNDCVGDSLFDQACQSFGGAEAVNGQLSNALQNPSDTYNSLSEGYDTYIGEGDIWDTAYDHGQDYLHDNYGDAYDNFYDSYDTYGNGGFYDAALDHGQDYLNDNYGDAYNTFSDDYYSSGFDTYDSYSYGDSYGDLYDSYSSGFDFGGRKLFLKK